MAVVADELLLNVKANVTQAMAGLETVERKGAGIGGAVRGGAKVAGKAIAGVGLVAAGVGLSAGNMALDFEEGMAKIEALVGVPKDEMETLKDAALNMGSEFGVSADEAAEGLFFLKSAGLDTRDAISNMERAAMGNAIGLGSMEELANTATTAMTNFGIDGEEAYDGIAQAARLAKADPAELGRIMNRNASTAALAGVSFDELGGVSALMTRKLGDASAAGTAIQGVLNKIVKPSQQAKDMLGEVGMSSQDLKDAVSKKGLSGALKDLNSAFADQGIATDEWAGKVFEDSEALKGAAAIIGTSSGELGGIMDGMNDKAGTLEEGWEEMADTGNVKLAKAFEGIKSALIPFGQTLQTLVVPLLETLAGWLQKGADWLGNFQLGADGFSFDSLIEAFAPLRETVAGMVEWWQENWDEIKEVLAVAQEVIMNIITDIREWAEPFIQDFIAFIQEIFGGWIDWFKENWPLIKETVMIVLEEIQRIWDAIWPVIQFTLERVWSAIKTVVRVAMDIIKGVIEVIMNLIKGDWEGVWNAILGIFEGIWDNIYSYVEDTINDVWDFLKDIWPSIKQWWDDSWNKLKDVFSGMFEGVIGMIRGPFNAVIGFIESGINKVIDLVNSAIDKINVIPGVNFSKISRVSIPRLAHGGVITRGGRALLNDSTGPETVGMSRGAMVRPSSPGDSGGGPLINIERMETTDTRRLASDIGWELAKRGAA